jgi:hypothetical protein
VSWSAPDAPDNAASLARLGKIRRSGGRQLVRLPERSFFAPILAGTFGPEFTDPSPYALASRRRTVGGSGP